MNRDVEQFEKDLLELVRKTEDTALDAGRKWAKAVGELMPVEMPGMHQVVKEAFDFTEEVLKLQRQFAFNVLKAMGPVPKAKVEPHTARTTQPRTRTTKVA